MPLLLILPLVAGGAGFLTGASISSKLGAALKILGVVLALFLMIEYIRRIKS